MQFNYIYEEADQNELVSVLTPGDATFQVKNVHNKDKNGENMRSSKGDDMIKVELLVKDSHGKSGMVYEYITSKMGWKLRALCKSIGKENLYNKSGNMDVTQLKYGTGSCSVKTHSSAGYDDKTVIDKFYEGVAKNDPSLPNTEDDDLPF